MSDRSARIAQRRPSSCNGSRMACRASQLKASLGRTRGSREGPGIPRARPPLPSSQATLFAAIHGSDARPNCDVHRGVRAVSIPQGSDSGGAEWREGLRSRPISEYARRRALAGFSGPDFPRDLNSIPVPLSPRRSTCPAPWASSGKSVSTQSHTPSESRLHECNPLLEELQRIDERSVNSPQQRNVDEGPGQRQLEGGRPLVLISHLPRLSQATPTTSSAVSIAI
jgi:hypothetical protein